MKPTLLFAALPLALIAAPALAENTMEAPAEADASAKPEKEKKVCRMVTGTGSVMPKRVCKTQAQLDAEAAANATANEQFRRDQQSRKIGSMGS